MGFDDRFNVSTTGSLKPAFITVRICALGMEEDAEVAAAMANAEKPKRTSNKSSKSKSRVKQTSRPKSVVSGRLMQGRVCTHSWEFKFMFYV